MRPPDLSGKKTKVCEFLREHPSRACTVLYMSTIAIGTWAPVKQQNFNPGAFFFLDAPGRTDAPRAHFMFSARIHEPFSRRTNGAAEY